MRIHTYLYCEIHANFIEKMSIVMDWTPLEVLEGLGLMFFPTYFQFPTSFWFTTFFNVPNSFKFPNPYLLQSYSNFANIFQFPCHFQISIPFTMFKNPILSFSFRFPNLAYYILFQVDLGKLNPLPYRSPLPQILVFVSLFFCAVPRINIIVDI